jgi:hypothetical protein
MHNDEAAHRSRYRLLIPSSPTGAVTFEELAGPAACGDDRAPARREPDPTEEGSRWSAHAGPDTFWEFL